MQGDSYSRCWQSTMFSFSLVFWTVKGNEWFTFKCNTEFWGRYSPYLPTFCPSRLEQHNFTLTAHQSSNSLCLEILSPPHLFHPCLWLPSDGCSSGLFCFGRSPYLSYGKKSFRSLGLNLTIVGHSISLSGDKLFPPLELLRATRQLMAIKYFSQRCYHLTVSVVGLMAFLKVDNTLPSCSSSLYGAKLSPSNNFYF